MANNRMFLVHMPTGLAVSLGKRMAYGWYTNNEKEIGPNVNKLFEVLETEYAYNGNQDDFAIALEDASYISSVVGNWKYGENREDGLIQLLMDGENL